MKYYLANLTKATLKQGVELKARCLARYGKVDLHSVDFKSLEGALQIEFYTGEGINLAGYDASITNRPKGKAGAKAAVLTPEDVMVVVLPKRLTSKFSNLEELQVALHDSAEHTLAEVIFINEEGDLITINPNKIDRSWYKLGLMLANDCQYSGWMKLIDKLQVI